MSVELNMPLDVRAYLARIGYSGDLSPTAEVLFALHHAHVTSVPFENLDVYLGKGIRIDLASVQAKIVQARRGGYCFEQNSLFAAVLESLGFKVTRLAARVRMGATRTLPRTHMVLKVEAGGESWMADVGFGWWGVVYPMPLRTGELVRQGVWQFRMKREGEHWVLESLIEGAWQDQYVFSLEPQLPEDYEMANYMTSTHPESRFVLTVTAQRASLDTRRILKNRDFIICRPEGRTATALPDDAALLDTLSREFGIVLPEGTSFPRLAVG
ncbi:MAG TPA: arylamine N-acetyltransferase [Candidatus Limnocylindria bacterium]|nr:arylamine N-acetyltransferase [Candidatus Limnocylindria bacterium]